MSGQARQMAGVSDAVHPVRPVHVKDAVDTTLRAPLRVERRYVSKEYRELADFAVVKERQRLGRESGDYPRVLDVARGQGNAAIAAARRFAQAIGADYVSSRLKQGHERASAEPSASFSHPDQEQAAAELVRVTRAGGTIALAVPAVLRPPIIRLAGTLDGPTPRQVGDGLAEVPATVQRRERRHCARAG
jgi:hypothetical protein